MPLGPEGKRAIVAEVAEVASSAVSLVGADYRGLTVSEMTDLRAQARNSGVYLRVVRNTLARRAVEGTEFACAQDALVGPLVLAFSTEEPSAAARLLKDFVKGHKNLEVKLVAIGGKLLDASSVDAVAKLPTYDEAIAQLMSVIKAPVTKLVGTLAGTPSKLVRTLAAVRDQKQETA